MSWIISALQRRQDLNCSRKSAWASPRRVASVWQFLTKAPHFLCPTHFCLGSSAVLKLWGEEQPWRGDSGLCWRPGADSEVELAHRPTAALYHSVDSGSAQAGGAVKGCSDFFLAYSLPKKCPTCSPASIWLNLPLTRVTRLSHRIAGKGSTSAFLCYHQSLLQVPGLTHLTTTLTLFHVCITLGTHHSPEAD